MELGGGMGGTGEEKACCGSDSESESEATLEAERSARDVEPCVNARLVMPTELRWMPKCDKESVPENSEDGRTVEEILSGTPNEAGR